MKHLKTFEFYDSETGQALDYDVGDTVISADDYKNLKFSKKYKVLKIYKVREDMFIRPEIGLGTPFMRVDIEDLDTGEILKGWKSTALKKEEEFDSDLYNL